MHTSTWICILGSVVVLSIAVGLIVYDIVKSDSAHLNFILIEIVCGIVLLGLAFFSERMHSSFEVKCEECGSVVSGADAYCPECGEPYSRDTCDYCMSAIDKNQKFCGECGKKISE